MHIIGERAFADNTNIESVFIYMTRIKTIEEGAFRNCSNLKDVTITGYWLEEIRTHSFSNCAQLKSISLPVTLKVIEDGAFEGCSNLRKIALDLPGGRSDGNMNGSRMWNEGLRFTKDADDYYFSFQVGWNAGYHNDGSSWDVRVEKEWLKKGYDYFLQCLQKKCNPDRGMYSVEALRKCELLKKLLGFKN